MNKKELIEATATATGVSKADTERVLNSIMDNIENSIKKGEPVQLTGFASFSVARRNARECNNPATGQKVSVPAKNVCKIRIGSKLSSAAEACKLK